jgi:hypothetical protein
LAISIAPSFPSPGCPLGQSGIDFSVVGLFPKEVVSGGLQLTGRGDEKAFVGFDENLFPCGSLEAQEHWAFT